MVRFSAMEAWRDQQIFTKSKHKTGQKCHKETFQGSGNEPKADQERVRERESVRTRACTRAHAHPVDGRFLSLVLGLPFLLSGCLSHPHLFVTVPPVVPSFQSIAVAQSISSQGHPHLTKPLLPLWPKHFGSSDPSIMMKKIPSSAMPAASVNTLVSTSCSMPSLAARWIPLRMKKTGRRWGQVILG